MKPFTALYRFARRRPQLTRDPAAWCPRRIRVWIPLLPRPLHPQRSGAFQAGHLMRIVPMFASLVVDTRRSLQCFASLVVDTRRSFAQAAQSRRTYNGICHFFSRDRAAQHNCHHPCWKAAYFLPCTRPPDVLRLPRAQRGRIHHGPSQRRAFVATRSGFQTMPRRDGEDDIEDAAAPATARGGGRVPQSFGARARAAMLTPPAPERPSTPADLRTALRPPASFGVTLFAINVGCPADRPRTPGRIHSEDHIISQRFSPPSTGCISGGHTSLSLYW